MLKSFSVTVETTGSACFNPGIEVSAAGLDILAVFIDVVFFATLLVLLEKLYVGFTNGFVDDILLENPAIALLTSTSSIPVAITVIVAES
jgi:hypothetical protein